MVAIEGAHNPLHCSTHPRLPESRKFTSVIQGDRFQEREPNHRHNLLLKRLAIEAVFLAFEAHSVLTITP